MPNLAELTDILRRTQRSNLATWIPTKEQLPENMDGGRSDTLFLALMKQGYRTKPDLLIGWYDYERQQWRTDMGPIDRVVTHWQEMNYPPAS